MEEKREPESFMMRVARFIVNKRKAFIALFILACIYSVLSMSKVKVINDLTDYLPESTGIIYSVYAIMYDTRVKKEKADAGLPARAICWYQGKETDRHEV